MTGGRLLSRADEEQRKRRLVEHLLGDRAEEEARDAAAAMSGHHDQVRALLGGSGDDLVADPAVPDLQRPLAEQRDAMVARFEAAYLAGVLEAQNGNLTRAALAAGVDRSYLRRLLQRYRLGPRGSR